MDTRFDTWHFLNECYSVFKSHYPNDRASISEDDLSFVCENRDGLIRCSGGVFEFEGKMFLSMRAFYGGAARTTIASPAELPALIEQLIEELLGPSNVTREEYFGGSESSETK